MMILLMAKKHAVGYLTLRTLIRLFDFEVKDAVLRILHETWRLFVKSPGQGSYY